MPLDFPRDSVRNFEGETIDFKIGRDLEHRLRQLGAETGATLFHVLLAAGYIVLSKYSGQEDIVVGTAALGRDHLDLQGIIGIFVNLLALRCQPAAHKTFLEFLAEVKEKAIDAYQNQDYPFEELVRQLNIQGSARQNPLVDVVFNFINTEMTALEVPGLTLKPYRPKGLTSRFDLVFLANDTWHARDRALDEDLELGLTYSSELFKAASAEDIGRHYLQVLEQVTAAREIKLAEIKISTRLAAARSKIHQEEAQFDF